MKATKVKGAVACPICMETVDPEEHGVPETEDTWKCPECDVVQGEGAYIEDISCSHDPPEVVRHQCPECEQWVEPQEWVERKQCPLCEEWFSPEENDFEETEVFKCGECGEMYDDRDDAKECCRD